MWKMTRRIKKVRSSSILLYNLVMMTTNELKPYGSYRFANETVQSSVKWRDIFETDENMIMATSSCV